MLIQSFTPSIADLIKQVLKKNDEILSLAKELYEEKSLLLMGRGYNYATCLEGALKVKEVTERQFFKITVSIRNFLSSNLSMLLCLNSKLK